VCHFNGTVSLRAIRLIQARFSQLLSNRRRALSPRLIGLVAFISIASPIALIFARPLGATLTAAVTNIPNGYLEVLVRGSDGTLLCVTQRTLAPGNNWSSWQSLPGPTLASAPVVATGASGWPLVFIKATDGALWYIEQLDSERWSTWATLGGAMVSTPTVIMNGERHLEIFAVGAAGDVWHIVNTEPHVWSNWESLGMKAASRPILGLDYRRCLEMFVASDDSSTLLLYRREQIVPCGSAGWSEPVPLGTFDPEVALTHNEHGVLEVFAIRHNSFSSFSVTHSNQDPTDLTKWSEFVSLANAPRGAVTPIALHDDAARPHLFATGSDGMLWTIAEVDAQSTRTNWSELGRPASGDIFHFSVGQNDDGRFEAFAIGADMNIWHKWETKLRGDWSDWVPLRTQ
jgi:hypothetical protein